MRTVWKKTISMLCIAALLCMMFPAALAADGDAGYRVVGTMTDDSTLQVSIYIYGTNAVCGRFALGFDSRKLEIPEMTGYFSPVVDMQGNIRVTGEGKEPSELVSQEKGHVMFAWYPYGNAVDCKTTDFRIAIVTLKLKDGFTEADLDNRSLYMYGVPGKYQGWESGAWLRGYEDETFLDFKNCVAGFDDCGLEFSYPNCDKAANNLVNVQIDTGDTAGSSVYGGTVRIENQLIYADARGRATFQLPLGQYTMLVTAPGYEDDVFDVTVRGTGLLRTVSLRSMQKLVDDIAANLELDFQGDDTADHVTRDLVLYETGEQNTKITWESHNTQVLSNYGNIFRQKDAVNVSLTATVSKDGKHATKTFTVIITAEDVPETPIPEYTPPVEEDPEPLEKFFTDLGAVSWAEEAIERMHTLGYINGIGGTKYDPMAPITRADFLCIAMRIFDPTGESGEGFDDVKEGSYYHDAVVLAQGLGIAKGDCGKFDPTGNITREDMIVLTYRLLEQMDLLPYAPGGDILIESFPDGDTVASYARDAMSAMLANYYIQGKGAVLAPKDNTNRAEAAVFLYRIYEDLLEVAE